MDHDGWNAGVLGHTYAISCWGLGFGLIPAFAARGRCEAPNAHTTLRWAPQLHHLCLLRDGRSSGLGVIPLGQHGTLVSPPRLRLVPIVEWRSSNEFDTPWGLQASAGVACSPNGRRIGRAQNMDRDSVAREIVLGHQSCQHCTFGVANKSFRYVDNRFEPAHEHFALCFLAKKSFTLDIAHTAQHE